MPAVIPATRAVGSHSDGADTILGGKIVAEVRQTPDHGPVLSTATSTTSGAARARGSRKARGRLSDGSIVGAFPEGCLMHRLAQAAGHYCLFTYRRTFIFATQPA